MSNLEDKISKSYFSISEVSEITELKAYVLRYWEKEFQEIKPQKNNVGVRKYTKADIELILSIKELLYKQQFTIKGAKIKMKADKEKRNFMPSVDKNKKKELLEVKEKIESLIRFIKEE